MKKSLLLLALVSIALIFFSPQVNSADRDVGYSVLLPMDNNAVFTADCQGADMTFECVTVYATRLILFTRYRVTPAITSTSNGGAGY